MEGIEQNPVVYDLMSEMAFQNNKVDVEVMLKFYLYLKNVADIIRLWFHFTISKLIHKQDMVAQLPKPPKWDKFCLYVIKQVMISYHGLQDVSLGTCNFCLNCLEQQLMSAMYKYHPEIVDILSWNTLRISFPDLNP